MMKIFICEDNNVQLKEIRECINKHLSFKDYDMKLEMATKDPLELLDKIRESDTTGLYFIDVNLNNEMNGIELAANIRELDLTGKIVFVTTHAELSYLTFVYKIEAMDYILKDPSFRHRSKINECIDVAYERYLNEQGPNKKTFIIKSENKQIKVYIDDINFIESSSMAHKLIIHMDNRQIEFYGRIKEMDKVASELYRCHQSYVININNIESVNVNKREIIMRNGEKCYVSIRCTKELLNLIDKEKCISI